MTEHEDALARRPQRDILEILREYTTTGGDVYFPNLTARLTRVDLEDEARREALLAAAREKLAQSMERGSFAGLNGAGAFFEGLGVEGMVFSDEVVDTIAELTERVGDGVFKVERSLYNGKTLDGLTSEQERERVRSQTLLDAGYTPEQLPGILPKFNAYREIMIVLRRYDPEEYNHQAFVRNVVPLFNEGQQLKLGIRGSATQAPQISPVRRREITGR